MWDDDDVERWLTDYPLPQDFTWKGEVVWPRYGLKKGYGFWLRTAGPYHPQLRGLFQLIASILKALPAGAPMPTPEHLVAEVKAYESVQETLGVDQENPGAAVERIQEEQHERDYQARGVARAAAERDELRQNLGEKWPTS